MTVYTATEHGKPIPETASEFATMAILTGLEMGRDIDGFQLEAEQENEISDIPKHSIDMDAVKVGDSFPIGNGWTAEILRSDDEGGTILYIPEAETEAK